jgi:hypothetical protein
MKLNVSLTRIKLLGLGLLIAIFSTSYAQENSSGIFLKMKSGKKNSEGFGKIVLTQDRIKSKSVYVPENPIIPTTEFVSVSEITNNLKKDQSYFKLTFSDEGVATLKELTTTTDVTIVLIMENVVVGELKAGEIRNKSIQISGPANSSDVQWANTMIKKIIDGRNK